MDVLVTYDIDTTRPSGVRRLSRVATLCEGYGVRVQKSVFECRLTQSGLQRLLVQLEEVIDRRLDSVNVYAFPETLTVSRKSLGRPPMHEPGRPWIT